MVEPTQLKSAEADILYSDYILILLIMVTKAVVICQKTDATACFYVER